MQDSWVWIGQMILTNTPAPASTGAFSTVTPGKILSMSLHFPADSTTTFDTASGGFGRRVDAFPISVSFFGNAVFRRTVGPAMTGHGVDIEVINNGSPPFELTGFSMFGIDGDIFYDLQIAGGLERANGSVGAGGYPEVSFLYIFPQYTLRRFDNGVLTDTLTGQLTLTLNAN